MSAAAKVLASAGRHEMLERCLRSLAALPGDLALAALAGRGQGGVVFVEWVMVKLDETGDFLRESVGK